MNRSSLSTSDYGNLFGESSQNPAKRLGANTIWLLLGRAGSHVLAILVTILIARRLGEAVLGQFAFVTTVLFVLNGVSTLGTDVLLVREIAAKRSFAAFPGALMIQLGLSTVMIVIVLFASPFLSSELGEANLALRVYSLALFPLAFYTVFGAALRGKERMALYSLVNLLAGLLQVIVIWLFVRPETDIVDLSILLLSIQLLAGLLTVGLAFFSLAGLKAIWNSKRTPVLNVVKAGAPIALFGLLATVYQRTSLYLLATMEGPSTTGWFSAALRVVEAPKFLHVSVLGALLPMMSQTHALSLCSRKLKDFSKIFSITWISLLALSTLAAALLFAFGSPIISMLFGERFGPSVEVLKILSWGLIPFTVSQYLGVRLLAAGRERQIVIALGIGLAALVILSLAWIPTWGSTGAAWAAVAAESVHAIIYLFLWNLQFLRPRN